MPELSAGTSALDLSILIPAYNEEEAIEAVIAEIRDAMKQWSGSWEILVVNDASDDHTQQCAERTGVRVIGHVKNVGYGAALKTGIRAARGRVVAMLDGDGSYDPVQLPFLLSFFPTYDQVNGARTSEEGTSKLLRIPTKWMIRKLTEVISGERIPDLNTGFKVFKRDIMLQYLWVQTSGLSCSASMTIAFLCNDHAVKYVPVSYRKRAGQSKFRPVLDSLDYLSTSIRSIMYFRPLRVFLPVAAALFVVAVIKIVIGQFYSNHGLLNSDVLFSLAALVVLCGGLVADLVVAHGSRRKSDSRFGSGDHC